MKFTKIKIKNFMKIEDAEIEFDSKQTIISGENGSKKSTILSALTWCLFGKDFLNRSQFDTRRIIDESGKVSPENVSVWIEIENDGVIHSIKRELGKSATSCWINDIPSSVGELNDFVAKLTDGADRFKLYSQPLYFFSLHWKEQRDLLMKFFPMPSEELVAAEMEGRYEMLTELAKKYTPEQIVSFLKSQIKENEAARNSLKSKIELLNSQTATVLDEKEVAKQYREIESAIEIATKKLESVVEHNDSIYLAQSADNIEKNEIDILVRRAREAANVAKDSVLKRKLKLLDEVGQIQDDCFTCPTCKRVLPTNMSIKIVAQKESLLEQIKDCNALYDEIANEIWDDESRAKLAVHMQKREKLALDAALTPLDKHELQDELANLNNRKQSVLRDVIALQNRKEQNENLSKLESELKSKNVEKEELENKLSVAEEFITKRSEIVVKQLNSKFKKMKIRLFEKQKNGEDKETFEVSVDGVPFSSLNTASQLACGIELSNFLTSGLGIQIPIIIDNGERYCSKVYKDIENQLIVTKVVDEQPLTITGGTGYVK